VKREQVFEFFRRLAEENPSPTTELEYDNPYTLLVAVVLSAQATDASVNIATRPLFEHVETPEQMVELGEERLREAIKTIGLFNTKAKNVIALSEALIRDHRGQVPRTREELEKLPGVGRKTANVVLNTAFGEETFAVDTHIFRVCNRTGLAPGKHVLQVELKLEKVVPQPFRLNAHHWLILHGRYICKARLPECWRCPVIDLCRYKPKTLPPDERAKAKSSAARSASRGRSAARTAKGPKPRTPSAGRSRARPSRLP
jgi:endonuclease-3